MPSTRANANAFYLLIAMAVSLVLALPSESAQHTFGGTYWDEHSCETAVTLLNRGLIVQGILTPLFVFLLPGAGSIIASRIKRPVSVRPSNGGESRGMVVTTVIAFVLLIVCPAMLLRAAFFLRLFPGSSTLANATIIFVMSVNAAAGALGIVAAIYLLRAHMTGPPAAFFTAAWLFAAAIPVAWWYGLKHYAEQHGLCEMLFDRSLFIDPLRVDDLNDSYRYFVYLSVFTTMWVGTAAAGLRLQSARERERVATGSELRAFRNFFWVYLLGWAVQYRVSLWSTLPALQDNVDQEWLTRAFVTFIFLTASSLWTLAFIRWYWKWRVRAWWASVSVAFAGTFVIHLLTMLTFFWFFLWAGAALIPLLHWNVWGMLWALTVGTWRWQALRQQRPVAAASAQALRQEPAAAASGQGSDRERPPALAGLKAVQIVAIGIGTFLVLALLYAVIAIYVVLHQRPHYP